MTKLKMQSILTRMSAVAALVLTLGAGAALAAEQPAGEPIEINGMQVRGVFLQAVEMEPPMPGQEASKTDIHLEADIVGIKGNENGFGAGAWIPYLRVSYELKKDGSSWTAKGTLDPMVASDGPHYGANVKLDGPGNYKVKFNIQPPSPHGFMRHTDKETGVGAWWKPFDYEGSFVFAGTGKKGGY